MVTPALFETLFHQVRGERQHHTDADRRFFQVRQSTREYGKRGAGGGARVGELDARVGEQRGLGSGASLSMCLLHLALTVSAAFLCQCVSCIWL
jgi:hypothetical protein